MIKEVKKRVRKKEPVIVLDRKILKTREAAAYLRISDKTLWLLTNDKTIPVVKIRGSHRYELTDLDAYIEKCKTVCESA